MRKIIKKNLFEARLKKQFKSFEPMGEKNPKNRNNFTIVQTFMEKNFSPRTKSWGSTNLKIIKYPSGWGLLNYKTLLAFITHGGRIYINTKNYSSTTSKIQRNIDSFAINNPRAEYVNENMLYQIANEENLTDYEPEYGSRFDQRNRDIGFINC